MFKIIKLASILLFVLFLVGCKLAGKQQIPTSYFFFKSDFSNYHISPNGESVSYIQTRNNVSNMFINNVVTGNKIQITFLNSGLVKSYFWASDTSILYVVAKSKFETLHIVNIKKRENHVKIKAKKIDFIDNKLWYNKILVAIKHTNGSLLHAYSVNINTWKLSLLALNTGSIIKYFPDNNGEIKLAIANFNSNENILYRNTNKKKFKSIANSNFEHTIIPLRFSPNNNSFYALSNKGRDKIELVSINCKNGTESALLKTIANADVTNVGFKNLIPNWVTVEFQKKQHFFLNNDAKILFKSIQKRFKNLNFEIIDNDKNNNLYIIKTYSDKQKDIFYLFDKSNNSCKILSNKAIIASNNLCEMKPVNFVDNQGNTIYGYLTLPKNDSINLPCVVIPVSNPNSINSWTFNPVSQFLANRGYGVLQISYRGCVGYGQAYKFAGFKNWGLKMQADIFTGAKWLINNKIADSKNIGIFGFQFGGFSSLNAAYVSPQIFKCAASYSGINNLFTYIKNSNSYSNPYQQMIYKTLKSSSDATFMQKMSPVFNSDKINIPLFIIQGGKDKFTSETETNQFVKILRKKNIKVKYLVKNEEGNNFKNNNNIVELYNSLENFFNQNLK